MLDPELAARLDVIEAKAEAAYGAAEKTRKYLFWTGVVSIAVIVLPMIGLVFVIPSFISNYVQPIQALTGNNAATAPLSNQSQSQLNQTMQLVQSLGL